MNEVITTILNNLVLPAIIAAAGIIIAICNKLVNSVSKSIELKNELYMLQKQIEIRNKLINIIGEHVKIAVASNMMLANDFKKEGDGYLTEEQQHQLQNNAKKIINDSIASMLGADSRLLEVLGGEDALNAIINAMIEKYVYEYKLEQKRAEG